MTGLASKEEIEADVLRRINAGLDLIGERWAKEPTVIRMIAAIEEVAINARIPAEKRRAMMARAMRECFAEGVIYGRRSLIECPPVRKAEA